ncbi:MAG: hypothetical protein ACI85O_001535 [Saprospiraceae bacterium]
MVEFADNENQTTKVEGINGKARFKMGLFEKDSPEKILLVACWLK